MTMKRILTFPLLLGLVLMAGAADAETLYSPPLAPDNANEKQQLDCYLVNVSDTVREATIEVRNRDGVVLKSVYVTLAPGAEAVATVEAIAEPRYCKFDVQDWRANFRASVLVREEGLGTLSALPAQ